MHQLCPGHEFNLTFPPGLCEALRKKFLTQLFHMQTQDIVPLLLLCQLALEEPNLLFSTLFMKKFAKLPSTSVQKLYMV